MQDFSKYSYIIQTKDIEKAITNAIKSGFDVKIIINGEYYDVDLDGKKQMAWQMSRKGR